DNLTYIIRISSVRFNQNNLTIASAINIFSPKAMFNRFEEVGRWLENSRPPLSLKSSPRRE
ncbi:hypothetical protein DRQ36_06235, partial [bacterium]